MKADVIVAGGGHNGLVAAIAAAQGGHSVLLLEQADHLGGATVGERVFAGMPARLSRYSYLISLFPQCLVQRLGIELPLRSRRVSSYTPLGERGLLVERNPGPATEESFRALTGSDAEWRAWRDFYAELGQLAQVLAPALSGPLRREHEVRDAVLAVGAQTIWNDVVHEPIGAAITRRLHHDVVRGIAATDALIGTYRSLFADDLQQNICFLYHLIGRGSGEWLVPVGGMGALVDTLEQRARELGVQIRTGHTVTSVGDANDHVVVCGDGFEAQARYLLCAAAPATLAGWLSESAQAPQSVVPQGSQLKINMLLDRLPRLRSGADPEFVFAGTTHLHESFSQLEAAYLAAKSGVFPKQLPAEIYCHSLTDDSILNGFTGHTLTLFGLHTPASLFADDPEKARQTATEAALASLQEHLAEPLVDCLARDENGWLCLEAATPLDVQAATGMPGGHIFHGDLSWPWLADDEPADIAAQRYGVAVAGHDRILMAGSGSRRGGAVSGLGGVAAVDALMAMPR